MSLPDETGAIGPQPPPENDAGARIGSVVAGRYEVRERLGRGGHATVFRAYDRLLKTEVALKVVHPERDPDRALSRIRREVEVARESQSPHLIRVFELGESEGDLYLTMEILSGGSLRKRLRQGPLPIPEALRIAEAVLRGLGALHAQGVVHRDVTPGNILFAESGEVKLSDFGLVRRLGREETLVTRDAAVLGTLGYLSPEQILGKEVGPRSDLYSLGAVLFEMLAGRPLHEAASEFGLRLAAFSVAPDVREFRPEVPGWLAETVARLLERRSSDRFPSAEAALAILEKQRRPPRYRLRRRMIWAAVLAFILLASAAVFLAQARSASFSHLAPAGETGIAAVSTEGKTLWTKPGVDPDIAAREALARITRGGPRLLALVLSRPRHWLPEDVSTLSFLDPETGKVVKTAPLPSAASVFPNDPPRFGISSVKTVDLFHDGVDEIVVNYRHVPEAPSYVVLYVPRFDQSRVVYYARGHQDFQGTADLDGDGTPELLFAGIDNGWNWVNVVAAVRHTPQPFNLETAGARAAAAPNLVHEPAEERNLLWYAVIPRGHLEELHRLTIDEARRELTVHYISGKTWTLDFDGFPPGEPGDRSERQEARRATYRHLGEAERLREAGMLDLATSEAQAALDSARRAREEWLGQYAERVRAKVLVAEGKAQEGEALFASLAARAEDAPEVAYDAAISFHLKGDLARAIAWYEQGIGRESAMGAGKSKHEFLKGEVLALVEEKRYAEALAAVERFGATYPALERSLWLYREYVRWRSGERPQVDPAGVPPSGTDLTRYWELEFEFAAGAEPSEILRRVDSFLAERPETRAELLSLRGELLSRLGRGQQAAEAAGPALELVRAEAARSIIARGHAALVEERARRLGSEFRLTRGDRRAAP